MAARSGNGTPFSSRVVTAAGHHHCHDFRLPSSSREHCREANGAFAKSGREAQVNKRSIRLPRRVNLGRGYLLAVRLVSKAELAVILNEDEGASAGAWDVDKDTIYIRRDLSAKQRWETYWHELVHAIHDIALRDQGGI